MQLMQKYLSIEKDHIQSGFRFQMHSKNPFLKINVMKRIVLPIFRDATIFLTKILENRLFKSIFCTSFSSERPLFLEISIMHSNFSPFCFYKQLFQFYPIWGNATHFPF